MWNSILHEITTNSLLGGIYQLIAGAVLYPLAGLFRLFLGFIFGEGRDDTHSNLDWEPNGCQVLITILAIMIISPLLFILLK